MRISDWSSDVCSSDLTSGVTSVHVDFASAGQSDEEDVLAFAMGARLRDWRIDTYRTRLADTAKPSLKTVVIASPAGDLSVRWGRYSAVADGVALRSDERGVGKECVITWRYRWS